MPIMHRIAVELTRGSWVVDAKLAKFGQSSIRQRRSRFLVPLVADFLVFSAVTEHIAGLPSRMHPRQEFSTDR